MDSRATLLWCSTVQLRGKKVGGVMEKSGKGTIDRLKGLLHRARSKLPGVAVVNGGVFCGKGYHRKKWGVGSAGGSGGDQLCQSPL